jgi:membrane associated rhomboid family serine protease
MTTRRVSSGGGGGGGMTLSFPPFTRAVKWIIGINVVVFFVVSVLGMAPVTRGLAGQIARALLLTPDLAVHGWVWQVATYSFVNLSLLGLIFGMLIIWFLGAMLESSYGTRWLVRYYTICALGAAAGIIAMAYSGVAPNAPEMATGGVAGVYLGFLIAFGILFAEMEFMMFPLPFFMKAKYLAGVTLIVALLIAVSGPNGLLELGQLGGLIAGFIYIKFFHAGGARKPAAYAGRGLSDRAYGAPRKTTEGPFARMKNAYYKWKRRRAARKFEVYMRKQNRDVCFDEYGNYVPPPDEKPGKGNGEGKGGWVN